MEQQEEQQLVDNIYQGQHLLDQGQYLEHEVSHDTQKK